MDKSLRKLSRVELLELMVSLSEDYERLSAENARLKKMVSSQRLPRSTKIGSIAEAALEANGYFEAAQRSADEYLREIKHIRDELAVRSENLRMSDAAVKCRQAEERAQTLVSDAQTQANQIVARANARAEAIITQARTRADEALAQANRQSHAIVAQASQQAELTAQAAQAAQVAQPSRAAQSSRTTGPLASQRTSAAAASSPSASGAIHNQLTSVPSVYSSSASAASAQAYSAARSSTPADGAQNYRQADPYVGSRSYTRSAPAYAGGTPTSASGSTGEFYPYGRQGGSDPRRWA